MHPLVNIALRAGRDAAGVLAQQSERLDRIRAVETEAGQQVTSVEADADKSLLYHIRAAYPNHHVNSRISGEHPGKPGEPTWHLDPPSAWTTCYTVSRRSGLRSPSRLTVR